jgi:hypothetical protein
VKYSLKNGGYSGIFGPGHGIFYALMKKSFFFLSFNLIFENYLFIVQTIYAYR